VLEKKKGPLKKLMCGNGKFRENIHKKPEVAKPPKTEITIMPFQDFQKTSVKFWRKKNKKKDVFCILHTVHHTHKTVRVVYKHKHISCEVDWLIPQTPFSTHAVIDTFRNWLTPSIQRFLQGIGHRPLLIYWHTHVIFRRTQVDDKIAALEVSITRYESMLEKAETSEERKDLIFAAITAARTNLHDLFIQKSPQGK
jgi:hypothetical protein